MSVEEMRLPIHQATATVMRALSCDSLMASAAAARQAADAQFQQFEDERRYAYETLQIVHRYEQSRESAQTSPISSLTRKSSEVSGFFVNWQDRWCKMQKLQALSMLSEINRRERESIEQAMHDTQRPTLSAA